MYYGLINSMNKTAAPSYTARTSAFATATGITDVTILGALNTFDLGLISNSLDSKLHLFRPIVGGTFNTTKINFMNTSLYVASHNGGITYNSNYIQGNGVNGYVNENFNLFSNATLNAFGFGYYSLNNGVGSIEMGAMNASYRGCTLTTNYSSTSYVADNADYSSSGTSINTTAKVISVRRNGGNTFLYQGTTEKFNFANTNDTLVNLNMFSMTRNENGGAPIGYSTQQFGCVYMDKGLAVGEHATLIGLINTLMTSLGR